MTEFRRDIGEGQTGVRSLTPKRHFKQDRDPLDSLFARATGAFLEGAGKGFAKESYEDFYGQEQSYEDVSDQAKQFEERFDELQAEAEFDQEFQELSGPQLKDLRSQALADVKATARTIRALQSSGRLSKSEGQVRMDNMLREKLSNPILNMFRDDFLAASGLDHTGGPQGIANQLAMAGRDEQLRNALAAKEMETEVKHFERVSQTQKDHGFAPGDAGFKAAEALVADLDRTAARHTLTKQKAETRSRMMVDEKMETLRDSSTIVTSQILSLTQRYTKANADAGMGNVLTPEQINEIKQVSLGWFNKENEEISGYWATDEQGREIWIQGLEGAQAQQARQYAESRRDAFEAYINNLSQEDFLKSIDSAIKSGMSVQLAHNMPYLAAAREVSPEFAEYVGRMASQEGYEKLNFLLGGQVNTEQVYQNSIWNLTKFLKDGTGDIGAAGIGAMMGDDPNVISDYTNKFQENPELAAQNFVNNWKNENGGVMLSTLQKPEVAGLAAQGHEGTRAYIGSTIEGNAQRLRDEYNRVVSEKNAAKAYRKKKALGMSPWSGMSTDEPEGDLSKPPTISIEGREVNWDFPVGTPEDTKRDYYMMYGGVKANPWYWQDTFETAEEATNAIIAGDFEFEEETPEEEGNAD